MIDITILRAMAAAGATVEMILAAVEAAQLIERRVAEEEERKAVEKRAKNAGRMRNVRARAAMCTDVQCTDVHDDAPPSPLASPSPPSFPPHPPYNPLTPSDPPFPIFSGDRSATRPAVDQAFDEFWKAYPKRDGANPKHPAALKFAAALKSGTTAAEIAAGAAGYRAECDAKKLAGTPMVAQAVTWLNQRRWTDYAAQLPPATAEPRGHDPPELPPGKRHFYRWFSSRTPEGLPPEQWQAFAEGKLNGAENPQAASLVGQGDCVRQGP